MQWGALIALDRADKGNEVLLGREQDIAAEYDGERLLQFCSGRFLIRQALLALGGTAQPILRRNNGAPAWPDGYTGSLSHSGGLIGVIAGGSGNWLGMGLDIERMGRFGPELWPLLFTREERRYLEHTDDSNRNFLATALFSIKEAFLKLPSSRPELLVDYLNLEVICHRRQFSITGSNVDLRRHFGLPVYKAEVFQHEDFVVGTILLAAN